MPHVGRPPELLVFQLFRDRAGDCGGVDDATMLTGDGAPEPPSHDARARFRAFILRAAGQTAFGASELPPQR